MHGGGKDGSDISGGNLTDTSSGPRLFLTGYNKKNKNTHTQKKPRAVIQIYMTHRNVMALKPVWSAFAPSTVFSNIPTHLNQQ